MFGSNQKKTSVYCTHFDLQINSHLFNSFIYLVGIPRRSMADKNLKLKRSQTKVSWEQINCLLPLKYLISLLDIFEIFNIGLTITLYYRGPV